jgi:hypothetical protein
LKRILIVNPRSDAEFQRLADAAGQNSTSPEELQQTLRRTYPEAVVRPRDLEGEQLAVWYVYREGRWMPGMGGLEVHDD